MKLTFICLHCGRTCRCNPRIKHQNFCFRRECQQARKQKWEKNKYHTNSAYRKKRLESQKIWRKKRRQDQYQKAYRENHHEYVIRCRELQRMRYKKQQEAERKVPVPKIVNTDAIFTQPATDGVYARIQVLNQKKIVNTDTFIVKMQIL